MNGLPLALLVLAVLLASVRLCRRPRPPGIRLGALLVLQLAAAVLLWLTLFPPPQAVPAGTLLVAGAGTRASEFSAIPASTRLRLPDIARTRRPCQPRPPV